MGRLLDSDGLGISEAQPARALQEKKRGLKENWFSIAAPPENCPGIYEWKIEGVGVYVGQATRLASRMRAYRNNVRKIINKLPWRKGSKREFRLVHHALRDAHDAGTPVMFSVLEICPAQLLNEREPHWIDVRRAEEPKTGLKVLNSN